MIRFVLLGFFLVAVAAHAATDPKAKCQATKIKAAGQKTFSKVKCHQKAVLKGLPVDPDCLAKAESKFVAAIAKADSSGTCVVDAVALGDTVDTCVASYLGLVVPVCAVGDTDCSGVCVDLEADEDNCGACAISCDVGETCQDAECTPICGDGLIRGSEECDDDPPAESGDGCSALCLIESGFSCVGEPSVCSPL